MVLLDWISKTGGIFLKKIESFKLFDDVIAKWWPSWKFLWLNLFLTSYQRYMPSFIKKSHFFLELGRGSFTPTPQSLNSVNPSLPGEPLWPPPLCIICHNFFFLRSIVLKFLWSNFLSIWHAKKKKKIFKIIWNWENHALFPER